LTLEPSSKSFNEKNLFYPLALFRLYVSKLL
jgi:hypothetical protein